MKSRQFCFFKLIGYPMCALLVIVSLSSCASTNLTATWHDPNYVDQKRVQDVLIIAVSQEETIRRLYEDSFVEKLSAEGVRAIPSYSLQQSDIKPSKQAVDAAVASAEANFVLITRHLSTDTKQHYRPPEPVSVFADPYYSRVHRYYPMAYREVYYTPGYTYDVTTVSIESNLYDAKTEKLVWTGQSNSIDPKMNTSYMNELVNIFANDLKQKGLL